MGYLIGGFAFASQPDWEKLNLLSPKLPSRGYKHRRASLFMWDVWRPNPRDKREHFPFSGGPIGPQDVAAPRPVPSPAVLNAFDAVCGMLEDAGYPAHEVDLLGVPLLVAAAAGVPTFAFAGDDEALDFAAYIDAGVIQQAGCRLDPFELKIERDKLSVLPVINTEDEEEEIDDELLVSLGAIQGITVLDSKEVEGGRRIHDHPSRLWPKGWGDPEGLFGLGTWDPFEKFAEDFELVSEANPSNKPWWKPWG